MNRQKQKGFTLTELLTVGLILFIIIGCIGFGWVANVSHVLKKYPPVKDWGASQVVCTVGIVAIPVGIVCGWVDGGVPDPVPVAEKPAEQPTSVPVDDLVKG